jgi:phosphatidylglycerol lysyltransferase
VAELSEGEDLQERCALQTEWLQTRPKSHALTFLTRESYRDPAFAHLTRIFAAYRGETLEGLVEFDPIFCAGNTLGYYVNLVQFKKGSPNGTSDIIIEQAFSRFRKEGSHQLSFGMSPLAKLSPCMNEPLLVRSLGNWLFEHANSLYSFKGNYFHKEKYRGVEVPVFFATRQWNALPNVMRLFRLVGIF